MNHDKIYHSEDILDFGKNAGFKLKEVFKFQPSYIEWAIMSIPDFKVDLSSFMSLKKPTTINYYRDQYNPERLEKFRNQPLIDNLKQGITGDSLNNRPSIGVAEIKEMILDDCTIGQKIDYQFPEWVVLANNAK